MLNHGEAIFSVRGLKMFLGEIKDLSTNKITIWSWRKEEFYLGYKNFRWLGVNKVCKKWERKGKRRE